MHNYIEFIERIYENDNSELNTNIVFKDETIKNEILNKYAFSVKNTLEEQIINNNNKCMLIIKKIALGEDLSQLELDYVCSYISRLRSPLNEYDILLKFIFGKMRETNLKFSYQVQYLVLSYIPYFYGANLENVRYVIGNKNNNKMLNGPGLSYSNYIAVNKRIFVNVNISSIDNSSVERLSVGNDITFFMVFAFHEMTHQYQKMHALSTNYNDDGMAYIISVIMNRNLNDYRLNHDSSESEINANYYGWEKSKEFYQKFYSGLNRELLLDNCDKNKNTSNARRAFAYKIDSNGDYLPHYQYDVVNIVKIIENNPHYLEIFPMLKTFFNNKGRIKYHFMLENDMTTPIAYEFCFAFFNLGGIEFLINNINDIELDDRKINNLLTNCFNYINLTYKKISDLSYALEKNNVDEYINSEFNKEIVDILSKKYLKFALSSYDKFVVLLNKIVVLYPNEWQYINNVVNMLNKMLNVNYTINKQIDITKK